MNAERAVALRWLNGNGKPSTAAGTTWGIPWMEGDLRRDEPLRLVDADTAVPLPMQSWPTAYWPDGSVKWSAHAAVLPDGTGAGCRYAVSRGKGPAPQQRVTVTESEEAVTLDTGTIAVTLGKRGGRLLRGIVRQGVRLCESGDLICVAESRSGSAGERMIREQRFESRVDRAVVEQGGPLRVVVRVDGKHWAVAGTREWLPFTLRFYAYAGADSIRVVHTFFYDGNPDEDFIRGLGVRFRVPMRGPLYNRHVRFAGDRGYFAESPKTLHTRRTKGPYRELFERQTAGEPVGFDPDRDGYFLHLLDDSATWDSFKLVQSSSGYYRIVKRTEAACSWLKAAEGRRAGGLAYIGGEGGGLAVGLRDFWEKAPSGFETHGMSQGEAELTVWLWSPDADPMDMRHYDTKTHVESSYEGAEELRATPFGIANTSEWTLWGTAHTPRRDTLDAMQELARRPAQLVCEPEHYHRTGAFGYWSLPDRSTPARAELEDRLDGIVAFYKEEVEQRRWYGFWDYGDFMHSYDPVRHVWNYDLGGCAWQNTELAANMWLWVMFLRTGRSDIYRLAEAMTRHTSEVDVYHMGEYAGLGSRHNVVHWGCGCKEARIAMAGLHRYYYYLTADERIGDILDEVKDADYTTVHLDPMRAYFPKDEHPTHARVGPDWAAFSSNWMTRWERFEDTFYRDKIKVGIECIKQSNYRLLSGPTYGYDPATGRLAPMGDDNYARHMAICMGAPQVWFELARVLNDPVWEDMLAEFGVYYNLPQERKDELTNGAIGGKSFEHPVLSTAIAAFGAFHRRDPETARRVWTILLGNPYARVRLGEEAELVTYMDSLREIDWINTNEAAQWSLNTVIALELIPEALPEGDAI